LIEELNGATQNIELLQRDKAVLYEATHNLVGVLKLLNGTIKELESSSSLSVQQEIGKLSEQRKREENQVVIELANLDLRD
jgi:16S rRNA C1402 (ribose-2'-O) methylase RsmI